MGRFFASAFLDMRATKFVNPQKKQQSYTIFSLHHFNAPMLQNDTVCHCSLLHHNHHEKKNNKNPSCLLLLKL